jgi:RimJ/RimL family protein N-acetyltransferase
MFTSPQFRFEAWAAQPVFRAPVAGRHLSLVRRSGEDVALLRALWADRGFMERFHRLARPLPADDAALRQVLERESQSTPYTARSLHWTIVRADGARVGLASLVEYSAQHRRAELVVGLREQPAGMALEATLLLLEFAFGPLALHKVCSAVYGTNEYALRSTLHLGFVLEGTLRDHVRDPLTGEFVSLHQCALFRQAFLNAGNQRLAQRLLGRALG